MYCHISSEKVRRKEIRRLETRYVLVLIGVAIMETCLTELLRDTSHCFPNRKWRLEKPYMVYQRTIISWAINCVCSYHCLFWRERYSECVRSVVGIPAHIDQIIWIIFLLCRKDCIKLQYFCHLCAYLFYLFILCEIISESDRPTVDFSIGSRYQRNGSLHYQFSTTSIK